MKFFFLEKQNKKENEIKTRLTEDEKEGEGEV